MNLKKIRPVFLVLIVLIVTSLPSCHSAQECKVKVEPSVSLCKDTCNETEGIYRGNMFSLDAIEAKYICKF